MRAGTITIEGKIQSAGDWNSRHSLPLLYKRGERFDLSDLVQLRTYTKPVTDSPHILCELDYHEDWPENWTKENQTRFETRIAFVQIYRLSGRKDEEGDSDAEGQLEEGEDDDGGDDDASEGHDDGQD